MQEYIHAKGAREHNLKNIDIKFRATSWWYSPSLVRLRQIVLKFDTIYAEGSAPLR